MGVEYAMPSAPTRVGATVMMRVWTRAACKKESMMRAPPSTMRDLIPRWRSLRRTSGRESTVEEKGRA